MKKQPTQTPPLEEKRPDISAPSARAGGIPAVLNSMKHAIGEAGLVRGTKELLYLNQMAGFDCPGCAWPDPDDKREMTEFCENGAKAVAEEATTKRVDAAFFAEHSVASLAELSDYEIGKEGRLTEPMFLDEGASHYKPISWDDAFRLAADELKALSSPNEAVFYTSGRTSNEAAFAYQLFARLFGTNNLPDCSNMCHESSGVALMESIGIGKGTVKLDDFDIADCIVLVGQNPGTNHPRMLTALQRAAKNNCKIISVNPLFEAGSKAFVHPQQFWHWFGRGTKIATLHVPVRSNSDIAFFRGVMKEIAAADEKEPGKFIKKDFIALHTVGFEAYLGELKATSWDEILLQTGLSREIIRSAAEVIMHSKSMIICWAMGVTQQTHGVQIIQEIVNLLLMGGHFGRPGAGACPVRGHSNVQGDRTMGIYEKPGSAFLDPLDKEFDYKFPRAHGWDVVDAIKAMHRGEGKLFFGMGGNFLSATPDTDFTAEAIRKTRLSVQVSTKLNRGHLVTGKRALIFPCLGRTEIDMQEEGRQFVTCENSMGVVQKSEGNLKPLTREQKSEVAIICGLGEALFRGSEKQRVVNWAKLKTNYALIRDHIGNVIPGFASFNQKAEDRGGFYLPNGPRDSLNFETKVGKAIFKTLPMPTLKIPPKHLMLGTVRSHDQFNTTIYGLHDRYRGVHNGRRVIFMNSADIKENCLEAGQWVDITSHFNGINRKAEKFMVVEYDIPKSTAATYFPETNVLVPIDSVAGGSNTPTYKSILITVAPTARLD
jgi:molybdopterin-dependent oxidoreductase alpha subunit